MLRFLQYRILKHGDVVWQTSIGSASVFKLEEPLRSRRYNSCAPTDFHELPWFMAHGSSKKWLFAKHQMVLASSAKNCKMVRSTSAMVASFDCALNVAFGGGGELSFAVSTVTCPCGCTISAGQVAYDGQVRRFATVPKTLTACTSLLVAQ